MAITRSVTTLLPATDLVAIRTRLADHYGSELYDGDDRRILCIHVPRDEPDPVNDVEAAVEYLDPDDVEQATHVLLIGRAQMAQVYAEPFRSLLRDRVRMDDRIAHEWRQRLPGGLGHQFFRDPADPRRRWRLAVRLPVEAMNDVEDDLLEPLADELGPQLETPRVRELAAVYLIASRDHVRLAPDLFAQELLKTWRDEERRRRIVAERERVVREERERKEHERRKLMAQLDRTLRERASVARAPLRSHVTAAPDDLDHVPAGTRLSPRDPTPTLGSASALRPASGPDAVSRPGSELGHDARTADRHRPSLDDVVAAMAARPTTYPLSPSRSERPTDADRASLEAHTGHPAPPRAVPPTSSGPDGALFSTDDVIQVRSRSPPRAARTSADDDLHAAHRAIDADVAAPVREHQNRVRSIQDKVEILGRRASELTDRPGGRLGRIAQQLMDRGFDVLVRPETRGPRIDLAAERPDGDPRRIVVRVEDKLTADAADKALTLARTLRVDQVVVVAETAEAEAERRLLATKVQWLTPRDLAAARL